MNITVTSILRRVLPIKGFCYREARWIPTEPKAIEIGIEARKGSRPRCGCCRKKASVYDTRPEPRCWQFIMLWGILVFFVYAARRVNCKRCGVRVEHLPWASGKFRVCDALRIFLAQWARLLSWQDVAVRFRVSWADVYGSVKWVVKYGLRHRDLSGKRLSLRAYCVRRYPF